MVMHTLAGFLEMVFPIKTRKIDTAVEQLALVGEFRKQGQEELARIATIVAEGMMSKKNSIYKENLEIESLPLCVAVDEIRMGVAHFYLTQGYKFLGNLS